MHKHLCPSKDVSAAKMVKIAKTENKGTREIAREGRNKRENLESHWRASHPHCITWRKKREIWIHSSIIHETCGSRPRLQTHMGPVLTQYGTMSPTDILCMCAGNLLAWYDTVHTTPFWQYLKLCWCKQTPPPKDNYKLDVSACPSSLYWSKWACL